MIILYSVGLLANFNTETSTGILQITGKVRLRGVVNLIQTVFSVSIIGIAFLISSSSSGLHTDAVLIVLLAYLVGKSVLGLGVFTAAQLELRRILGRGWTKASLRTLASAGELFRIRIQLEPDRDGHPGLP